MGAAVATAGASPLPDPRSIGWFAPLERWAAGLRALGRWPLVSEIDRGLSASAGVRFEEAAPRPRTRRARRERDRTRAEAARAGGYDRNIVERGVVATRPANLHDLMNALVWAAFPRSKRALHARQHALVTGARDPGKRTLEHDTIAMLDEGGVLLFDGAAPGEPIAPERCFVFGHAVYQHLAEGRAPVFGLGVPLGAPPCDVEGGRWGRAGDIQRADGALAGMLISAERFLEHRRYPRVRIG
jgi:hypothetical protein